jgi:hypothetical protein
LVIEINSKDFIKQATFTNLCKQKAIILQLLDPEVVNNFSMLNFSLLVETVPLPARQKAGTSKCVFLSPSPLKTKGCDRYTLAVAPLIDFFKCLANVAT